ncbi:MAG: deoxynucleoside kinase [Halobacteriovoraceae bacterium]|nr:deoxynucleoside kinase [Halobacteriovoraceae bacterium]
MKMIIIEGNIGAGKSTLTRQLSEALKIKPFYEPVETNPYLEMYYNDPKNYALPMQFYLMSNRYEFHLEGITHIWKTGQSCIYDRSIYGDYIFAKKNWLDGNMSDLDFDNYNKMRNVMLRNLMIPHITIYLKNDPTRTYENIKMRSRNCESDIPLSYLTGLDQLYHELMIDLKDKGSRVIELDWNEFRPVDFVVEQLKEELPNTHLYQRSPLISESSSSILQ